MPGAELARSTSPVEGLTNTNPEGVAVNVPALAPEANTGVGLLPDWQNDVAAPEKENVATGAVVMVTIAVSVLGQGPLVVYTTVYVPRVLALRSITPVEVLMEAPAGLALKTPPVTPVIVGTGSVPDWQNVLPVYENAALSSGVIDKRVKSVTAGHPPAGSFVVIVNTTVPAATSAAEGV